MLLKLMRAPLSVTLLQLKYPYYPTLSPNAALRHHSCTSLWFTQLNSIDKRMRKWQHTVGALQRVHAQLTHRKPPSDYHLRKSASLVCKSQRGRSANGWPATRLQVFNQVSEDNLLEIVFAL